VTVDRYFETDGPEREEYLRGLSEAELLQLGIDLYNAGHYWNAHEAWEEAWMEAPAELRDFYQGLIQVTAAFVHLMRNEYPGSVRLLASGVERLERYEASFKGLRLAELRDGAGAVHRELMALGERRIGEFDRTLIPRIEWTSRRRP
jgi:predicted metal-dependent hydrolase